MKLLEITTAWGRIVRIVVTITVSVGVGATHTSRIQVRDRTMIR